MAKKTKLKIWDSAKETLSVVAPAVAWSPRPKTQKKEQPKPPKNKKTESLIERLKRQKKEKQKLIDSM